MARQFLIPGQGIHHESGGDEYLIPGIGIFNETTAEALEAEANAQTLNLTPLAATAYYAWTVNAGVQTLTLDQVAATGEIVFFRRFPVFPAQKTGQTQANKRKFPLIR